MEHQLAPKRGWLIRCDEALWTMDSTGLSRREFVRKTGLAAAAVGFGGSIDLGSDPARATSANSSALSDYERYDGSGPLLNW